MCSITPTYRFPPEIVPIFLSRMGTCAWEYSISISIAGKIGAHKLVWSGLADRITYIPRPERWVLSIQAALLCSPSLFQRRFLRQGLQRLQHANIPKRNVPYFKKWKRITNRNKIMYRLLIETQQVNQRPFSKKENIERRTGKLQMRSIQKHSSTRLLCPNKARLSFSLLGKTIINKW